MTQTLNALIVIVLSIVGFITGLKISKKKKSLWIPSFIGSFTIVILIALGRQFITLTFVPPISWLMHGTTEYFLFAPLCAIMIVSPFSTFKGKPKKALYIIVMCLGIAYMSLTPFVLPLLLKSKHEKIPTVINKDGVCLQRTLYTCGPASSVTALGKLGIEAEEGELAILVNTTFMTGTPPDILSATLNEKYGQSGIKTEYRKFENINELKQAGMTLVILHLSHFVDHYITVFEVTDDKVIVGDPLSGKVELPHDDFLRQWRNVGITIKRK